MSAANQSSWLTNNTKEDSVPWPWKDWRGSDIKVGGYLIGAISPGEDFEPYPVIGKILTIAESFSVIEICLQLTEADDAFHHCGQHNIHTRLPLRGWTVFNG